MVLRLFFGLLANCKRVSCLLIFVGCCTTQLSICMTHSINLCALLGWIGSGKDTVASRLESHYGWRRVSFAGALKDAVSVIFGWPREMLEGLTPDSRAWREIVDPWWANRLGIPHLTPRWVLQHLGTDVLRHHFHDDIWIAALEKRLVDADDVQPIIISDCRFQNEINLVRKYQGQLVQVVRNFDTPEWYQCAVRQNLASPVQFEDLRDHRLTMEFLYPQVHSSEYSWAGSKIDYNLMNIGSLDDLYDQIDIFTDLVKNR